MIIQSSKIAAAFALFSAMMAHVPDACAFPLGAAHQYFFDLGTLNEQAEELQEFMAEARPSSLPPLPQTENPYILLGLNNSPPPDFNSIRHAYKNLAKKYHPDVAAGPYSTAMERKMASVEFARINAAYDYFKRKEKEEVFTYVTYVDGQKRSQSFKTRERSYHSNNPFQYHNNGVRSRASDSSKTYTRRNKKWWKEIPENYRHNGDFGP